jgi:hypothetical protein
MTSESPVSFNDRLKTGLLGEDEISRWFIRKSFQVLPAYQIEVNHGKGPRLFTPDGQFISPDLLIFNSKKILWIEAKTKSAFTWHRQSNTFQTGIDRRHWNHYLEVEKRTPFPVWILFLHRQGCIAKDTPAGMESPSGLFGNSVPELNRTIHHQHDNWGPSGMVYWTVNALKKLADFLPDTDSGRFVLSAHSLPQ